MKNKSSFETILKNSLDRVGNTPIAQLQIEELENINLFAKLEFYNPTGSVKDRAAMYIIKRLFEKKEIDKDTTLIESSSGNFGIALSAYCKKNYLKFIAVVDPCILPINEFLIKSFDAKVIKVNVPDCNGGYLLNRIKKVNELINEIDNRGVPLVPVRIGYAVIVEIPCGLDRLVENLIPRRLFRRILDAALVENILIIKKRKGEKLVRNRPHSAFAVFD